MSFSLNTCEAEYLKDPKIKKEDVQQLTEWVEKQPHMPKVSEYMLIQIFFVSDYSIQRAKDLLETYYEIKHTTPELFLYNDSMRTFCSCDYWNTLYSFPIPKVAPDGQRILYFALRQNDPTYYHSDNSYRMWVRALMTMIMEVGICPGYTLVYDLKGYTFAHMAGMTISLVKGYLIFSQDAIPLRVKSVHIINGGSVISRLDKIFRPFMKKEITEMVTIHPNAEDIYKTIGREYFPTDVGGTLPTTRDELNEIMKARMNALSPMVMEELNLKTDESKRLHKKFDDVSSMDGGSFRKLQVD